MAAKRAKLRHLLAVGVPDVKLVKIINALREDEEILHGPPVTSQALKRALDEIWQTVGYIDHLPSSKHGAEPFQWDCASLPKMLELFCKESCHFQAALRTIFVTTPVTPETPLHLLVYADEVIPGAVLRLDNKRKIFCVYVSVSEFGTGLLKHEVMWMPIALIRSGSSKDIRGGISGCMKALFRRWFLTEDVSGAGVLLDLAIPGSRFARLYFKMGRIVEDTDAIRATWSCKGASGKLCCMLCSNVVNDDSISSPDVVSIACSNASLFRKETNATLWKKADNLHAQVHTSTKKAFAELELLYGLSYNPDGLLWDHALRPFVRPCDCITFDAMHVLVSNGMAQNETAVLLIALQENGIRWADVRKFMDAQWLFCKTLGSAAILRGCWGVAREKAWQSGHEFKCGASEMLMVQPILQHFLLTVVAPLGYMPANIASYEALGKVMSLIRQGKEGEACEDALALAVAHHAQLFKAAYSDISFKPKNHYCHHIPEHLGHHGTIVDAFVGERKHNAIKSAAASILILKTFERSVLMRVLANQLADLKHCTAFTDGLIRAQDCPDLAVLDGCASAQISSSMVYGGTRVSIGDAVFIADTIHIVRACVQLDTALALCTDVYTYTAQVRS